MHFYFILLMIVLEILAGVTSSKEQLLFLFKLFYQFHNINTF